MAWLFAILGTLARVVWRDAKSLRSLATNNFLLFSVYLLGNAGSFVYLVLALVMLFPLCADPLRKIPRERLACWPLTRGQSCLLRAASPWVNPMTWVLAAGAIWAMQGVVTVGLLAAFVGVFAMSFVLPASPGAAQEFVWRAVPRFRLPLAELVLRNFRGLLSTLDFYCAAIFSLSSVIYRAVGQHLPNEALLALTLLVALMLSSYAQSLFGLDGPGGILRHRLLPIRGWRILAAKGTAYLLGIAILTLPLAPLAGVGAGLAALAVGHAPSVRMPRSQVRWRFSTGTLSNGFLQVFAMALAGVGTFRGGPLVLIPCVLGYIVSLLWYGRALERTPQGFGDTEG